jgi:hypothetical protein
MITRKINSNLPKILLNSLAVVVMIGLLGCDRLLLSERQKIVRASHEAVCKENGLKPMRPYVSKNSTTIFDLSSSLEKLSQIFVGQALSDRIAIECHTSEPRFVDEI